MKNKNVFEQLKNTSETKFYINGKHSSDIQWVKGGLTYKDELPFKKLHNIKFPVDSELSMQLKIARIDFEQIYLSKYGEKLSQSKFNSLLAMYVLRNLVGEIDLTINYIDTKRYMHTYLKKDCSDTIAAPFGLAITNNLSERRVMYCVMKKGIEEWQKRGKHLGII